MPRIKAPSFIKVLGSRPSGGYDGLESDAPLAGPALPETEVSPGSAPLDTSFDRGREVAGEAGSVQSSAKAPSLLDRIKKPWKGSSKLRIGRSKVSTWENVDSETLRSPVMSPTEEGQDSSFPKPAEVTQPREKDWATNAGSTRPQDRTSAKTIKFTMPAFTALGAERHGYGEMSTEDAAPVDDGDDTRSRSSRGSRSQHDDRVHSIHSASSSGSERSLRWSAERGADSEGASGAAPADGALAQDDARARVPELDVEQPTASTSKKGNKLKLKLNLKASLRRISDDLSNVLKRNDGLNAQVTLVSPTGAAPGHSVTPKKQVTMRVGAFKQVGGSLNQKSTEPALVQGHHSMGYDALGSPRVARGSFDDSGSEHDDVDEVSSPHAFSRLTLSAHAPLRDGGFRPF